MRGLTDWVEPEAAIVMIRNNQSLRKFFFMGMSLLFRNVGLSFAEILSISIHWACIGYFGIRNSTVPKREMGPEALEFWAAFYFVFKRI